MTAHLGPHPRPPGDPKDEAVSQYERRIATLVLDMEPIPLDVPFTRKRLIDLLAHAQVVEIRNPTPSRN